MKGYYGKKVQILKVAHSTTECHEIVWYFDTSYKAGERGDQGGGGKIPGARSTQRGPEIPVNVRRRLLSLYACLK